VSVKDQQSTPNLSSGTFYSNSVVDFVFACMSVTSVGEEEGDGCKFLLIYTSKLLLVRVSQK
jgi:hypothetical protein